MGSSNAPCHFLNAQPLFLEAGEIRKSAAFGPVVKQILKLAGEVLDDKNLKHPLEQEFSQGVEAGMVQNPVDERGGIVRRFFCLAQDTYQPSRLGGIGGCELMDQV